jgi:hypothetical protein
VTDVLVLAVVNAALFFTGYVIGRSRPTSLTVVLPCPREPESPHRVWVQVRPRIWGKSEPPPAEVLR